jgi:G:T/U-mismatch repair DNA glycosylase
MVIASEKLPHMSADELREAVTNLLQKVATKENTLTQQAQELTFKQAIIDKLTHENAILKRLKFAAQSERYSAEQRSLLEETLDEDLQAVNDEIEQLTPAEKTQKAKQQPKRKRAVNSY